VRPAATRVDVPERSIPMRPRHRIVASSLLLACLLAGSTGYLHSPSACGAQPPDIRKVDRDRQRLHIQTYVPGVWDPQGAMVFVVASNEDDGTAAGGRWYPDGYDANRNLVGIDAETGALRTLVRFHLNDTIPERKIIFARLRVASTGAATPAPLQIKVSGACGIRTADGVPADPTRMTAVTSASVVWNAGNWSESSGVLPLYYNSPDLSPIINEMLARPDWGEGERDLILILEPVGESARAGTYVTMSDYSRDGGERYPAILEVYADPGDTFVGPPMLGRPTGRSVTLNVVSLINLDIYAEYGPDPDAFGTSTATLFNRPGGQPIEIVIADLDPDTAYYYRLAYRQAGTGDYQKGPQGRFRTQRAKNRPFVFTIQADSHILAALRNQDVRRLRLYEQTIGNVLEDDPDFHFDMGDFAHIEYYAGQSARSGPDAVERYLLQRQFLGQISNSIPFFLVLGNHEGEQGWRTRRANDSLEVWGTLARKATIPNPYPDGFYSGNLDMTECCGLREDYYAWEWGDALFVVLDPFWYTTTRPHRSGGLYSPSFDGWDWTLGKAQYDWLYTTLTNSDARWKFVFAHHMTGGVLGGKEDRSPYGRGGIDAAKFKVAGRPSFEWGGEDSLGRYVFETERPGWEHGPIHDLMAEAGVDIFFRGHDHAFIYETLDGVVYQTCPQPADASYSNGEYRPAFFSTGVERNSPGHLRVSVSADSVRVDYVRSILPEDEPLIEDGMPVRSRDISYSYTLRK
jgi:hypothetical protein